MIIISDYAKGVITNDLMEQVRSLNIPFIVDPKPENIKLYMDAYAITPNHTEYNLILENEYGSSIFENMEYVIHTMGDKGIRVVDVKKNTDIVIKANPVEVFNVSGAGDTVISTIAFCVAKGNDIITSCHIANECAHYVVTKPGTSVVPTKIFNDIYIDCGGK